MLLIHGGRLPVAATFQPGQLLLDTHAILQANTGEMDAVETSLDLAPGLVQLDASDCIILPGFTDLHIHGAIGADTMDGDPAALARMARFLAHHGVTAFLPTTMTADHAATLAAVSAVQMAGPLPHANGARVLGVHLEGPYISPRFPGAQLSAAIRPPDLREFNDYCAAGPVRMITLAPEQPGALALIHAARLRGIVAVVGHTGATYAECEAAIAAGVTQATHTYNAMTGLHHRQPGTLGSVLTNDAVYAQLIADNIHVHPAAMKVLARCKGVARTLLISDAIRASGLPPGNYDLGGQRVAVRNGECRLANGTLAGSILTLERALYNFATAVGLDLAAAWPAATTSPAAALGMGQEMGRVQPGYRPDLVLLDGTGEVVATVVGGCVVYLRDAERLRGDLRGKHTGSNGSHHDPDGPGSL